MKKTPAKKLTLNKVTVANLSSQVKERGDLKAPTYTGCSLFAKCEPPATKTTCA
ncbi:class I lanthipeptide [Chitinophaga caeni]|uniref:class I lanthipeptide n=1 Tax=Chitinophaga caeni TaxID=2029983 RepID=UPI0012FE101C|nr:class I lanthipeptide [Chitinophaga caeni]